MTKTEKIKEISANLRIAALNLSQDYSEEKREIVKIANTLYAQYNDGDYLGVNDETGAYDGLEDPKEIEMDNLTEEKPGRYDINRKPNLPLWNIQILRVNASDGNEAHDIVKKLIEQLVAEGHTMAGVGEIRASGDQTTPRGK